jgi:hypothetical protein
VDGEKLQLVDNRCRPEGTSSSSGGWSGLERSIQLGGHPYPGGGVVLWARSAPLPNTFRIIGNLRRTTLVAVGSLVRQFGLLAPGRTDPARYQRSQ